MFSKFRAPFVGLGRATSTLGFYPSGGGSSNSSSLVTGPPVASVVEVLLPPSFKNLGELVSEYSKSYTTRMS